MLLWKMSSCIRCHGFSTVLSNLGAKVTGVSIPAILSASGPSLSFAFFNNGKKRKGRKERNKSQEKKRHELACDDDAPRRDLAVLLVSSSSPTGRQVVQN